MVNAAVCSLSADVGEQNDASGESQVGMNAKQRQELGFQHEVTHGHRASDQSAINNLEGTLFFLLFKEPLTLESQSKQSGYAVRDK